MIYLIATEDDNIINSLKLDISYSSFDDMCNKLNTNTISINNNDKNCILKMIYNYHVINERPYNKWNIKTKKIIFDNIIDNYNKTSVYDYAMNLELTKKFLDRLIETTEKYNFISDCLYMDCVLKFIDDNKKYNLYVSKINEQD